MKTIQQPKQLQAQILELKRQGKSIGFVPTMGNLHAGHLSLIDIAKQNCDLVVSSIFVNPMQFGPNEDFDNYPRTLEADSQKLYDKGCDFLFTPTNDLIYPKGKETHTSVEVNRLTEKLCGASRPGHFKGVTTVVNILFNIVQPDIAVFGKKDYQQYLVIKAMVEDLMIPVKIIGAEIKREDNGLAMSSRNGYLSDDEKALASYLRRTLEKTAKQLQQHLTIESVVNTATADLQKKGFKIDYFEIVRRQDLEAAEVDDKQLLIAAAAWLGKPRLIDNLEVNLNGVV